MIYRAGFRPARDIECTTVAKIKKRKSIYYLVALLLSTMAELRYIATRLKYVLLWAINSSCL